MKKALSILLIVSLAASLCMVVFASDVTTVSRYCKTCGKETLQYAYMTEQYKRHINCPTHSGCTATEYAVYQHHECFKCCETETEFSGLRYVCPYTQ